MLFNFTWILPVQHSNISAGEIIVYSLSAIAYPILLLLLFRRMERKRKNDSSF